MDSEQKAYYISKMKKAIIFHYLDDSLLREILEISSILKCNKNHRIISEGEISPYFFVVIEGSVNVFVKEAGGKEVFVCAIGEGDVFGEAGIFIKAKRTANVVGNENTTLLRIHRKDLIEFIKKEPSTGIKLLMIIIYGLLKKLRDANQELAFERKSNLNQEDIDDIVKNIIKED